MKKTLNFTTTELIYDERKGISVWAVRRKKIWWDTAGNPYMEDVQFRKVHVYKVILYDIKKSLPGFRGPVGLTGKPAACLDWISAFADFTSVFLLKSSVFLDSGDLADMASVGFTGGGGGGVWGRTHRLTGGRRAKNKKQVYVYST